MCDKNYIMEVAGPDGICYKCGGNCMQCGCWLKGLDMSFLQTDQPERLNPETPIPEYGANSSLNFDEWQRRCDSLNS